MSDNIDLRIQKDAVNYLIEATDDADWKVRADEIRAANGGQTPQDWGCLHPMPSLRSGRQFTSQLVGQH